MYDNIPGVAEQLLKQEQPSPDSNPSDNETKFWNGGNSVYSVDQDSLTQRDRQLLAETQSMIGFYKSVRFGSK